MLIIELLSQPFWYRLGLTLTHFLWQGLVVAILAGVVVRLFKLSPGNTRYAAYLLTFIVVAICPVITFVAIDASVEPVTRAPVTEAEARAPFRATPHPILPVDNTPLETEALVTKVHTPGTMQDSIPLRQKIYDYLEASLPWAIAGWMIGVVALSMRLLLGFVGVCRWLRHLEPLPEGLVQRVASLSERLGMQNFSPVFISPSALQAMAVGYLRPLVLLPAAMVTRMQPEMLEAVIAHELAHIRRFDLWVNLAQRVMETLLFFHPSVWWLSNRLRSERELCCDELAVRATGERLTYASALETAGRARLLAKQFTLAAGIGQDKRSTLSRVRHILGLAPKPQNSRFWLAGVITVLFLAIIVTPTVFVLTAQAEIKTALKPLHHAAAAGDIEQVKLLISKGVDVNAKDEFGRTALHVAALQGRPGVAQLLIANGADLHARDKEGCTPLGCAAREGRIVVTELLIGKGTNVNVKDAAGNTPLHHAAIPKGSNKGRHIQVIRRLIVNGADVNARNAKGQTAAHVAAEGYRNAHANTVLSLNQLGTDVNAKDKAGNTLLHVAVNNARVWVTEDLLARGANVNETNAKDQTPLHIAAGHAHGLVGKKDFNHTATRATIAQRLIKQGANVNAADQRQSTALHEAARRGHTSIVEFLIANGANVNAKDGYGHIPAYLALRATYTKVADLLMDKGAGASAIYFAAYLGDLPRLKNLIANGVSLDAKDEVGFSPLHAAAAGGHRNVVEYLISQSANANAEAQPGWTALSYAAAGNHMVVVRLLRAKGVGAGKRASELLPIVAKRGYIDAAKTLIDLGAKTDPGERTALHEATFEGHKDMVELLISRGADVNAGSWTPLHITGERNRMDRMDIARCLIAVGADLEAGDWTPLMEAAYYQKDIARLLISEGADVNAKTNDGWTVLAGAVDGDRLDIAELLLDSGAKPNVKGENKSALHLSAWYQPNFIELLVAKGADVNVKDNNGWTPLHYSGRRSMDLLIAKGADVNARTNQGETILHLSATRGNKDKVQFVLGKGVDINAKDKLGWTALHRAIIFDHLEVAKFLVTQGADVNVKDNDSKAVLSWAQERGHKEIVEFLRKHGAKE